MKVGIITTEIEKMIGGGKRKFKEIIMMGLGMAAVLLLIPIVVTTTTTPTIIATVYAQGTPDRAIDYGGESSEETRAWIINHLIAKIQNMTDPLIDISEDGNLFIIDNEETTPGFPATETTNIHTGHPWTPENGYRIDNSILYAPNGTQVFP